MTLLRLALLVAVAAGPALAGNISINMTATTEVKDGNLVVSLKVGNSGDEAASSVVPLLRVRDKEVRGTRRDALNPGESVNETLTLPVGDLGKGRWPFRVAVDYTDANQYPFQALHAAVITVGDPSPAKVAVPQIQIPPLAESTTASFTVKNLAGTARDASVTVFAPDGLEAPDATRKLALPAWGTGTAEIELINRTALAGSRYPIFVTVEYDEDGTHQAVIANNTVEIRQRRALVSRGLLWGVAALVVLWLAIVVIRRQQRA